MENGIFRKKSLRNVKGVGKYNKYKRLLKQFLFIYLFIFYIKNYITVILGVH
jgi:hypothetical protein